VEPTLGESPNARVPGEWFPALVSTVITLPVALFLFGGAALAPMVCDNCNGAEADRFTDSFNIAIVVFLVGLAVPLPMMLASWCLPWRQRHFLLRRVLATLAPFMVLVAYICFGGLAAWPSDVG
jgi:hypothetical protein